MRLLVGIFLLCALSCNCVSQEQPSAIVEKLGDFHDFKLDSYIEAAAKLQTLGKEKGAEELMKIAEQGRDHQVIILCRMLFKASGKNEFRRPLLGQPHFIGPCDLEPITIIDGVPFCLVTGYRLAGLAESAKSYLGYCIEECAWNDYRFKAKTNEEKRAALAKYLAKIDQNDQADAEKILLRQIQ